MESGRVCWVVKGYVVVGDWCGCKSYLHGRGEGCKVRMRGEGCWGEKMLDDDIFNI